MAEPLIELKNIYKIYHMGDEEVRASDGVRESLWPLSVNPEVVNQP